MHDPVYLCGMRLWPEASVRLMGLDRATLGSQNVGVLGQVEVFPFLCSFAQIYLLFCYFFVSG